MQLRSKPIFSSTMNHMNHEARRQAPNRNPIVSHLVTNNRTIRALLRQPLNRIYRFSKIRMTDFAPAEIPNLSVTIFSDII